MELIFGWKEVAAVLSAACGIIGFIPYFYGIAKGTVRPHLFTWIIWTLTLGIANASVFYGGGGLIISIGIAINVVLCAITCVIALFRGSKRITRSDTLALIVAFVAIFIWAGLDSPFLALLLATGIDLVGYWPTFRKSFGEPWSESLASWVIYTTAPLFTLLSLQEYNELTITYSAMTFIANALLIFLLVARRKVIAQPAG